MAGQPVEFSLRWTDNIALHGYTFSFDNGTGTFVDDPLVEFTEGPGHEGIRPFARALYYVFPNLENFNLRFEAAKGWAVGADQIAMMTVYGLVYAAVFVGAASLVFRRKSF